MNIPYWKKYKLGEIISIKHGYDFKGKFFYTVHNDFEAIPIRTDDSQLKSDPGPYGRPTT